jgi:RNA polymerase sigma factor (TIGR02999 family)
MSNEPRGDVTRLLEEIEAGNTGAVEKLFTVAYDELRALAGSLMRRERTEHTLQPTALVNEAALRLIQSDALSKLPNHSLFFGAMATAMRRVLVDHARRRGAARRTSGQDRVPLDDVIDGLQAQHKIDLLELEDALQQLESMNQRQSEVVVRRFFGGYALPEIAEQLDVSLSTVEGDWRIARSWLRRRLGDK